LALMQKPFYIGELVRKIRELLQLQSASGSLGTEG